MASDQRRHMRERVEARIAQGVSTPLTRFAAGPLAPGADMLSAVQEDPISQLMTIAVDRARSAPERLWALVELDAARFAATRFAPHEADYRDLLRSLLSDPEPELRAKAVTTLAQGRDDVARAALLSSLVGDGPELVGPAKAIRLLAYEDHGEAVPIVQEYLAQTGDADVWDEGLRLLAGDPSSRDLLSATLADRGREPRIRRTAARALNALDPASLTAIAGGIVADDGEDASVRSALLAIVGQGQTYETARNAPEIRNAAERLTSDADRGIAAAARRLLDAQAGKSNE